jgi:hypothetical protein
MKSNCLLVSIICILLLQACNSPGAINTATIKPTLTATVTLAPAFGSYQEWLAEFNYDNKKPLNIVEAGVEQQGDVSIHDVSFDSPVQGKIPAYLIIPAGRGPFPAILYAHWYGEDNSNRKEFLDEAVSLAKNGVVSILVDELCAAPIIRQKWTGRDAQADRQLVIWQTIELRRAIDVLEAQAMVDPAKIGFVGHDFGGMYGAVLAGVDFRIKTFVLMTVIPDFTDWFTMNSALAPAVREQYRRVLLTVAPINYLGHAKASVYIQDARNDGFVPEGAATGLYEAAANPKYITWYLGPEGHSLQQNKNATQDRLIWLASELHFSIPTP